MLHNNVQSLMKSPIEIIEFNESLAKCFSGLNIAWLKRYFVVEPIDEEMLSNPKEYIIDNGGLIFFAKAGDEIAGTFAMIKSGENEYELSKMAVSEEHQGKNIGNTMLQFCLDKAKELHADKVVLFSNTLLQPAIHLYRKYGFKEVPLNSSEYKRSNVKMEVEINNKQHSRIKKLFADKQHNILNVYCTAGYPALNSTLEVMQALQANGADIIEIGMPYSDPLADGPVIQQSSAKAIENGMTMSKLFEQLTKFKNTNSSLGVGGNIPVILMGYMNPVLQYGFEKFCEKAAEAGVDGLILPDLPMYEYETEYSAIIQKYHLDFIFLITPETSEERLKKIDALSSGFIYAVSSSSTTGSNKDINDQQSYFKKLQSMNLKNPVLVGFGIKDKQTFDAACKYTNGAIIGTAYIQALGDGNNIEAATKVFLRSVLTGQQ